MARRRPRPPKPSQRVKSNRPAKPGRPATDRPATEHAKAERPKVGGGRGGRKPQERAGVGRSGTGRSGAGQRGAGRSGVGRGAAEAGDHERTGRASQGGRRNQRSQSERPERPEGEGTVSRGEGTPQQFGKRKPKRFAEGKTRSGKPRFGKAGGGKRTLAKVGPPREIDEESGGEGNAEPTRERLQKVLAAAGIASRRECEELIVSGRVEVDRKTVIALGTRVDPVHQEIRVDGIALPQPKRLYFAVHKPPGVVTTNYDPSGRPRVIDLVPTDQRVFPVGRLDRTSEGLIIVTNDGTLANLLTHPRYGVDKTYLALVDGYPDQYTLDKLRQGIHIAEGLAQAASVKVKRRHPSTTELIIVLDEGRNRQIRRMLARVGHKVLRLKRIAVGPLLLGDIPAGAHRRLSPQEVELLLDAVRAKRKSERKTRRRKPDAASGVAQGIVESPAGPVDDRAPTSEPGFGPDDFEDDADDVLVSEETLGVRGSDAAGAVLDWNDDEDEV